MAKLMYYVAALLIILLSILIANHFLVSDINTKPKDNSSIFGRSVYSQTDQIFTLANSDYQITFPQDHNSHNDFDIEWWYLTANLKDSDNNVYGLQWTLFRFRNPAPSTGMNESVGSAWHNNQIFMAHASVHTMDDHWFSEKFARGGVGNALVGASPFTLQIDDWVWKNSNDSEHLLPASLSFTATHTSKSNSTINASMNLQQTGSFVLHGENGYSVKSTTNHASHYYSAPFIDVVGTFGIIQENKGVTEVSVSGKAWFDQEWTSQLLDNDTLGWDWFSLHLDDGSKIMAFRMRLKDQPDFITGSHITADGKQTTLSDNEIVLKPISNTALMGMSLPLMWIALIPSMGIDVEINSIKENQYNQASVPYYEGMVKVTGSHTGVGFIELSGY